MRKQWIATLLTLCLLAGLLAMPASAAEASVSDALNTVQALGILNGDENGDLKLQSNVTRAEFCKMLVAASRYKDAVGGSSGYSLFKDVKRDHWAVEYIKVCVENEWFLGYLDGTFRPQKTITLEEAATVALRLLGYTAADMAGSYPTAQLSKFDALGLHTGFSTGRGETMTRLDCAQLFYNLLAAQTKEGQIYGQTLGYQLDASGHVDYASLVQSGTKGPFTLRGTLTADSIPFTVQSVYRNGVAAALGDAREYDVYYYNSKLHTVWIYGNRITGTYTAVSPSAAAPSSVTVAGVQYSIESSGAAYLLSTQGKYKVGDTVTLLLGMNGGVADVCDAAASGVYYGVVTRSGSQTVTAADGTMRVTKSVHVLCTDGTERVFDTAAGTYAAGSAVRIDYSAERPISTAVSSQRASGKVNAAATSLGDWRLAADVEILDTDRYGGAVRIYPKRLSGADLRADNVLCCVRNAKDEITHLILRDATGDSATYGVVADAQEVNTEQMISCQYRCIVGGQTVTLGGQNVLYGITRGAAMISYEDGQLAAMRNLTARKVTALTDTTAEAGGRRYPVSESVQVYIKKGSDYFPATVKSVSDTAAYTLTAYTDVADYPAGVQVRILVAEAK